jgi:hypothetical protein
VRRRRPSCCATSKATSSRRSLTPSTARSPP